MFGTVVAVIFKCLSRTKNNLRVGSSKGTSYQALGNAKVDASSFTLVTQSKWDLMEKKKGEEKEKAL